MAARSLLIGTGYGKALFRENCAMCHALDRTCVMPLRGFTQRGPWTDRDNVRAFFRDPQAFARKNRYLTVLIEQYGVVMTGRPKLTDQEIDMIVNYIEAKPQ